jgi:hypothetical protein
MADYAQHRRRASDRAHERAERAAERGDHAAYLVATAQIEEALRRRAEWRPSTAAAPSGHIANDPLAASD